MGGGELAAAAAKDGGDKDDGDGGHGRGHCCAYCVNPNIKVEDTVKGFAEILDGKHDEVPESNFYMKGGIGEIQD